MSLWQPIGTAPSNKDVLLFCPHRGVGNPDRIEIGYASSEWRGKVTRHPWATEWAPIPERSHVVRKLEVVK